MDELGIIIYKDGEMETFGKYFPAYDPEYKTTPKHDKAFMNEIVGGSKFKENNLSYDFNKPFHRNNVDLALNGIIIIQYRDGGILVYATANPTLEQIDAILADARIHSIPEQEVYEFIDEYEFIDHDSMREYANSKKEELYSHKVHIA